MGLEHVERRYSCDEHTVCSMAGQNLATTMMTCNMMRMKIMIKKSEGNIWTGTECLTMRAMSWRLGAPVKDLPMPGGETETERHGNFVIKIHR